MSYLGQISMRLMMNQKSNRCFYFVLRKKRFKILLRNFSKINLLILSDLKKYSKWKILKAITSCIYLSADSILPFGINILRMSRVLKSSLKDYWRRRTWKIRHQCNLYWRVTREIEQLLLTCSYMILSI
jgi:hypothetical protein